MMMRFLWDSVESIVTDLSGDLFQHDPNWVLRLKDFAARRSPGSMTVPPYLQLSLKINFSAEWKSSKCYSIYENHELKDLEELEQEWSGC
jgi:hypothetical protein